jgi:signal peptidase I
MNDDRGSHGQESTGFGAYTRQGQVDGRHVRAQPGDDGVDDSPWPTPTAPREFPGMGEAASGFGEHLAGDGAGTPYGPALADGDGNGHGPPVAEETGADVDAGGSSGGGEAGPEDLTPPRPPGRGSHARPGRRRRRARRASRSWWIELPILLVFALVLALLIKTFVVQAFFIPSSSMENTLEIGDKVLVNKLVYDFRPIHRGDIVVFNGDGSWDQVPLHPEAPLTRLWDSISGLFGTAPGVHDYIKRVIGVPGDHVVCCDPQGRITVNGVPLSEKSYLYPGNVPSTRRFSITVPQGRLWVMGDHRSVSYDSRGHMSDPGTGTVPENKVVGRAFLIVAPFSRWRILPIPLTFEQPAFNKPHAGAAGLLPVSGGALGAVAAPLTYPGASLVLGFAGALPLTWLQRRLRRRLVPALGGWVARVFGRHGPG